LRAISASPAELVDQLAGGDATHGEGELGSERQPWKIDDSGNRIRVAENEPPKMTIAACRSTNILRSPPS